MVVRYASKSWNQKGKQKKAVFANPTSTAKNNLNPSPNLVIEIANTSLADDRGTKRLLYEDLDVQEYWIVDVQSHQILAFTIANAGSRRINISQLLPNLEIFLLETALRRIRQSNHSEVGAWLLSMFNEQ